MFKHVQKGEEINILADDYNGHQDAAREHKNKRFPGSPVNLNFNSSLVRIKNTTGSDLKRFDVCELSDFAVKPEDNLGSFLQNVHLTAIRPTNTNGFLAVLLESIKDGSVGDARILGMVNVKVETGLSVHDYVGFDVDTQSTDRLIYDAPGQAKIIALQDDLHADNGSVWATIVLTPWSVSIKDQLDEDLSYSSTAMTKGGREVHPYMLKSNQTIAEHTEIVATCFDGTWYVVEASCE